MMTQQQHYHKPCMVFVFRDLCCTNQLVCQRKVQEIIMLDQIRIVKRDMYIQSQLCVHIVSAVSVKLNGILALLIKHKSSQSVTVISCNQNQSNINLFLILTFMFFTQTENLREEVSKIYILEKVVGRCEETINRVEEMREKMSILAQKMSETRRDPTNSEGESNI